MPEPFDTRPTVPYLHTVDTERVDPGGDVYPYLRAVARGPAVVDRPVVEPDPLASITDRIRRACSNYDPTLALLRAWTRAKAARLDDDRPPLPACPACGGEHRLCATCPACSLTGVPLCDDGQLSAHGSARGGDLSDGPLDADGWPTPGEWSGCNNRDPGAVPARAAGG